MSGHQSTRTIVATLLAISVACAVVALLGTVREPKQSPHHIWPIHSDYLLPLWAMGITWVVLGMAILMAVVAALMGTNRGCAR